MANFHFFKFSVFLFQDKKALKAIDPEGLTAFFSILQTDTHNYFYRNSEEKKKKWY